MEETPDIPAADDSAPVESRPFGVGDKALAGVLLVGVMLLGYVCLDVLAGGRLTGMLSAAPTEADE
ncbi:hypothetical protein [Streptomyces collinus]|uniref:Uncharacterized protein n=1 Tax=Streptomyces collinus (strain DSM 40733 / Tue 365) TaxID=1214242 RepID=S5W1J9_STRC3|nr:hypothetical protein [Streptomyces collinus]AGS73950.1 hypothetical protein B446_35958 [Streptomyces collinus Tu 365]